MPPVKTFLVTAGLTAAIGGSTMGTAFGAIPLDSVTSPSGRATCTITETAQAGNQAFRVTCSGTTVFTEYIQVGISCNNGAFVNDNFGTLNNSTKSKTYTTCGARGFESIDVRFRYNNGNG